MSSVLAVYMGLDLKNYVKFFNTWVKKIGRYWILVTGYWIKKDSLTLNVEP